MSADLRLVVDAAERYANALTVSCAGNAHRDAGFARARRAYKTQQAAAGLGRKLPYGKVFDNALLDLFKAEMILVESLARFFNISCLLGFYVPRQLKANVEIAADDRGLCRAEWLLCKVGHFLEELLLYLLRKLQVADLLTVFADIVGRIVLTELLLDYLHLLAQIVIALAAVYLLVCCLVKLLLNANDVELMVEHLDEHLQSAAGVQLL